MIIKASRPGVTRDLGDTTGVTTLMVGSGVTNLKIRLTGHTALELQPAGGAFPSVWVTQDNHAHWRLAINGQPADVAWWPQGRSRVDVTAITDELVTVRTTPTPQRRPFAVDSFWNTPLRPEDTVDTDSGAMINRLSGVVAAEAAAGSGPWLNFNQFGVPVHTVSATQATQQVVLDGVGATLQAALNAVPVPSDFRPADGSDHHALIYQPSTDRMWEFWNTDKVSDVWHADWGGAIQGVSTNPGVYDSTAWTGATDHWGATGSSLSLFGGLIRPEEIALGRIDHALAVALPEVRSGYVCAPAVRTDGAVAGTDVIPMGARLRIKPSYDVEAADMPRWTRIVARAAQKYGMIVRDYSGVIALYAEDVVRFGYTEGYPDAWCNHPSYWPPRRGGLLDGISPLTLLSYFPWTQLEVMTMSLTAV